jgi:hypothetical protein
MDNKSFTNVTNASDEDKIREADKKMQESYEEWKKCQDLKRRPGYAEECKESYNKFSKLLQEYNELINKPNDKVKRIPKFPQTVVLAVNTHGSYKSNSENTDIETFDLPTGITLRTITAAPMGTCNFVSKEVPKNLRELIDEYDTTSKPLLDDCNKTNSCDTMLDWITERYSNFLRNNEGVIRNEILESVQQKKRRDVTIKDETFINNAEDRYIYRKDTAYNMNKYENGAKVPVKSFSFNDNDVLTDDMIGIIIINMPYSPDLFDKTWFSLPTSIEDKDTVTTTKSIIEYLSDYGAKNIILMDFSCSTFSEDLDIRTKSLITFDNEKNTLKRKRTWLGGRKRAKHNKTRRIKTQKPFR